MSYPIVERLRTGPVHNSVTYLNEAATLIEELAAVLELLVNLKDERDKFGKTLQYEARKVDAWDSARAALSKLKGE